MKDNIEIGPLTRFDSFSLNRDKVMDLETWFKIHTNISNFRLRPLKPYKLFIVSVNFVILLKMGKHIDFHLSYWQIVGAP